MYSPEEICFVIRIGGARHFSRFPKERSTRCGIPFEEDDWHVNQQGFKATLPIAMIVSGREDLVSKYDSNGYGKFDFCTHCVASLEPSDASWEQVLSLDWSKLNGPLSHLFDGVFVAQLPKQHIIGWLTISTKPRQYSYSTGGRSGRGRHTLWHHGTPGETRTSWMPSRTYDTRMMFGSTKNAETLSRHLLDLRNKKMETSRNAELEFHRSEDIYLLCSYDERRGARFCDFITFTPPPEGINVEILTSSQLEEIGLKEIKPTLIPLDDIIEDEA